MTTIWELDFYSRPLVDEENKKRWEVLICESPTRIDSEIETLFRYNEFCPNSEVNSAWLKAAIERAIAKSGTSPDRIRFFRQAMNNMISKACVDAGLSAQLSRRTLFLNQWLRDRHATVYPEMDGYQAGATPSVNFAKTPALNLPDALRGDKWQFVSLPVQTFDDMADWDIAFSEAFPLSIANLDPEATIPGVLIYSSRSTALAAWMSGLELADVKYDTDVPTRLLLETGIDDRWMLVPLPNPALQQEAKQFEVAKQKSRGVHFIAIQANADTEAFAGFWLLQEAKLA